MHDKSMTKSGITPRKKGKPFLRIKHGNAVVPIYRGKVRDFDRFTVAFHMNGRRIRRSFGTLEKARTEAQIVAQRIQEGLAPTNDLTPSQRECYLAAERLTAPLKLPPVAVVDEYVRCRELLGDVPLMVAVQEFLRRTQGVTLGVKVADIIDEFLKAKAQDGVSSRYLNQLAVNVRRLAKAFPGEVMAIKPGDLDRWLRGLGGSPVTRNSVHRCIKVFFAFAKARGYLPASEASAAEMLHLAKTGDVKTEIFKPEAMRSLLEAATPDLLPFLAIGAFAGLRVAEIGRLDWSAVDMERRIILLRADQAKTASRRIVPISDNLAVWLNLLPRTGKIMPNPKTPMLATALAKRIGVTWPHNGMRHSYISYRIAEVKDAARVALEAGNSPHIIFKHYRELVTEAEAREWFSILPPEGWVPPEACRQKYAPRKRRSSLVDQIFEAVGCQPKIKQCGAGISRRRAGRGRTRPS
ncbi:tyrosine-type recombinase/integrase [Prosthecobacter sp.]|uniref:tyrosine-type recombinase/integrase n=1 Tax=Prosthecobacter sp. TaxID=1965333 RepID=UPI001D2DD0D1|nr:tyrosine-type recombinase/integrase [Prosthecobacter sp.]MCB1279722.1 tyrosine-type recombinase/integrase [Prosthecobacter sp.]